MTVFIPICAFTQSSWTELSPTGGPPAARTGAPAVYDSVNNRMIVFGGRDASGNNRNDVWVLTNANGEGANASHWIKLIPDDAAGSPLARSGHSAVYDQTNNRLIIFGGCSANCAPALNDVWVLTYANGIGGTPAWTQLEISGSLPPPRANTALGYDPIGNQLILFGGQDGSADPCSTFSDFWTLSNANGLSGSPAWTPLILGQGSGVPAGQNGAAAVYSGSVVTVFGGLGLVNGTCQATNAVWTFSPYYNYVWPSNSVPEGAAGSPSARSFASAVYDTTGPRMMIFGGVDEAGNYLNDVWSLFNVSDGFMRWSMLSASGGPPAATSGQAAVFDSAHHRMTVFGGTDASGVLNATWVLNAPSGSEMSCFATSGTPEIVRATGLAEQVGDVVIECTGGTPTPQGEPIPEYDITYTLGTGITSRLLPGTPGLSEALLSIDDPFPPNPVPPNAPPLSIAPPRILCLPLGSNCGATGTGGTPSPYQTQPNIFLGMQSNANTLHWKVPIDPPGENNFHIIRLTNVRTNASLLGVPGLAPPGVDGTVTLQGFYPIPVFPGVSNNGLLASVTSSSSIPKCEPHNAVLLGGSGTAAFDFSVQATEGFGDAFKYRNYGTTLDGPVFPPVLVEQNVLGLSYGTETGYYSPSLFTTVPTLGLADFGTRILISLGPVNAGTRLFVPTTITTTYVAGGGAVGELQLVEANEYGNSEPGYEPVASVATIGTTPVAQASRSGSTAYAVYEVINANPAMVETATIPVAVAFTNAPPVGAVNATTSLAPLSTVVDASESAPIPRFTNFSSAQQAYSITACAGALQ